MILDREISVVEASEEMKGYVVKSGKVRAGTGSEAVSRARSSEGEAGPVGSGEQ